MVRLLCLEDEDASDPAEANLQGVAVVEDDGRPNPNINGFSAALSCYPIVSQLARSLDLTSLHELSRTCRQFRANLLQYRRMLIALTLRCDNEDVDPARKLGDALSASFATWTAYGREGQRIDRITSGRVGECARDMVGECKKCNKVVCRNCILKPPTSTMLQGRHRRLCRTCMKAPLDKLLSHSPDQNMMESPLEDTSSVAAKDPCTCHKAFWICQPCGQSLRMTDTTYTRGWAWRTRYSACGGIGAGIGEGVEGVECGRGTACLAAREIYKELECDADELAALEAEMSKAELDGHAWLGSSYCTQEIVGIGGRVKKKVKKRVLVGAVVKEYEDERATGGYLAREQIGLNRSWCSWCDRVCLSGKDSERPKMSSETVASSSSSGSSV